MNALDSLFDFAALMSTSSAMTLPPRIKNVSNMAPQEEEETSSALPYTCTAIPSSESQGVTQDLPQQLDAGFPSTVQIGNDIAVPMRANAYSANQHSIDWISAPPFLQPQSSGQEHCSLFQEHSRLPLSLHPGFGSAFPCGHYPEQYCPCINAPLLSEISLHGGTLPYAWDQPQLLPRYPEPEIHHLQTLPAAGSACGYNCEHDFHGQLYADHYLPAHSYCIEDECVSALPRSIDLLHDNSDSMGRFGGREGFQMYHEARL